MMVLTRHDQYELSYVAVAKQPVKNGSARYKRLAQAGYLEKTRDGYLLTALGRRTVAQYRP
jgi:hypothetical protein